MIGDNGRLYYVGPTIALPQTNASRCTLVIWVGAELGRRAGARGNWWYIVVVGVLVYCWVVLLVHGNGLVGQKRVGSMVEHFFGEVAHEGLGLEKQVTHHGVGVPAAEHFDQVHVDFAAKESHGSPRSERPRADVGRGDAGVRLEIRGCAAELVSDVLGAYGDDFVVAPVRGNGRLAGGVVLS